jgi:inosine-uridine nucleoside N-ribohydrolase
MTEARFRIISDNDYSGDPDGLVQLAHHALSPSVELPAVIGSHLRPLDPFDPSETTADNAAAKARQVLAMLGHERVPVVAGSNTALVDRKTPRDTPGARAIIAEAMRDDDRPLFVCCGAGLTSLASAWLLEPRIATRLTAVWIGGAEHPDLAPPLPGGTACEYNTAIDIAAAQVVLNDSDVPFWQVPRDAYRQVIVTRDELDAWLRPQGAIGEHLFAELDAVFDMVTAAGLPTGETYVLGDSPLVLLTALQTMFEPTPASSGSVVKPAPVIDDAGGYVVDAHGRLDALDPAREIRVWTQLDAGLLIRDLCAKLTRFARSDPRAAATS